MKLRKGLVASITCFSFLCSSCAANIARTGYQIEDKEINTEDCQNTIIVRNLAYDSDLVDILGSVKASDTGFSVKCSEDYVINNFKNDACVLNAELINITEEKQPDFWSSCYRAKAEFLKVKDRELLSIIGKE